MQVYNKTGIGGLGDRVLVAIKGQKKRAFITGVKQKQQPFVPRFDSNNIVLVEDNGAPTGTRIRVPIPSMLRSKKGEFTKILAIATKFVWRPLQRSRRAAITLQWSRRCSDHAAAVIARQWSRIKVTDWHCPRQTMYNTHCGTFSSSGLGKAVVHHRFLYPECLAWIRRTLSLFSSSCRMSCRLSQNITWTLVSSLVDD